MEKSFQDRVRTIEHDKTLTRSNVVYYTLDKKVIIRSQKAHLPTVPYKQIICVLLVLVIAKGAIFQVMGEANYRARVMEIGQASFVEKAGSYIMRVDPATRAIAGTLKAIGLPQLI